MSKGKSKGPRRVASVFILAEALADDSGGLADASEDHSMR